MHRLNGVAKDFAPRDGIEPGEPFVEDQEVRLVPDGNSERDQRTLPPMRIGAGNLPQEFRRNICRLLRLSISPTAFAVNNFSVVAVLVI